MQTDARELRLGCSSETKQNYKSHRVFLSDRPSPRVFDLKQADQEINIPQSTPTPPQAIRISKD